MILLKFLFVCYPKRISQVYKSSIQLELLNHHDYNYPIYITEHWVSFKNIYNTPKMPLRLFSDICNRICILLWKDVTMHGWRSSFN